MTFIEFLGFIIAMLAFFFLIVKQAREEKRRKRHPELYEKEIEEQQAEIKDILESLNIHVEKETVPERRKKAPAPPPLPQKEVVIEDEVPRVRKTSLPLSPFKAASGKGRGFVDPFARRKKELEASFDAEVYQMRARQRVRVTKILEGTDSMKHAVILKEILGPPKGLW